MKIAWTIASCVLAVVTVTAGTPAQKPPAKPSATEPKFKAIWEPVPFNRDVNLNAIACPAAETCWVVGDKSTILFTADGGSTWEVQLGGDPESTDENLTKVFALDPTHAWAMNRRGQILATTDGANWTELATMSGTSQGVWFTTPQDGIEFENADSTSQSTVQRSTDAGRTWTPESRCSVDATVNGLPRTLDCRLFTAQFLSPLIGFAGGSAAVDMGTSLATFGRTGDGGRTWTMSVLPESKRRVTGVSFWTETDGIIVTARGEELFWTADGGATWTKAVKQRQWPSSFAVGSGTIIAVVGESGGIAYSFNGGRNFTSRPLALPARVSAMTFPDAEHGYLVGQHAMVYRYRIVPIDYKRQGMIAAMAP